MNYQNFSESHRRTISSALKVVERLVVEIESALKSPVQETMFVLVDDVDHDRREQSLRRIKEIKTTIARLHSKYNLPTEKLGVSWMIQINKTKIWEVLCNTTSKRLNNYGTLPSEEAPGFDNDISQLMSMIEKL